MKTNKTKTIVALALVVYTSLVGMLGFGVGKYFERRMHRDDGVTFITQGDSQRPYLDIIAQFGNDEAIFQDVGGNYARELAPQGSFAAGCMNDPYAFASSMRYLLLRDPEKFKAIQIKANRWESRVKVVPGKDTEYKYGLY
jgi:hypothetical protein